MSEKDFVSTLRKGMDVLTSFGREHPRQTVSEVARRVHCTPAAARRSLLTLQDMGFLDSDGKHYWMLPRTLLIAHAYLTSRPLPSLAQPMLDAISERTRESASLGELLDTDAIIIARSTARRSLSTGLGVGARLPAFCSAMGRVLLASLPAEETRKVLRRTSFRKMTPNTVVDPAAVLEIVEHCREEGFGRCDGELEVGVRSIAVPVFNRAGATIAALSVAVRTERMSMQEFCEAYIPLLHRARAKLTKQLY